MKKTNFKSVMAILAIVVAAISMSSMMTSCKKSSSSSTPATMTLYDTLGGSVMVKDPTSTSGAMIEQGYLNLRSVVDSAIFVIAVDTALNTKFFGVLLGEVGSGNLTGYERLSTNLTNFFAVATGAKDYTYTGLSMTNAHNPATNPRMGALADSANFNQFVGDVATGAIQNGVSTSLIDNHIAPIIFSVEGQVVQAK
jgi:hypothetical protein